MDDLELTPASPAGKTEKKKVVAEKAAPAWSKYLKSATAFSYTDPDTKIRFSPAVPVRIDGEPKEGSWLKSQMDAGLIIEA